MAPEEFDGRVDLDRIIAARFPGRKIPRFIVDRLKRFIHQDWMNAILSSGLEGAAFCDDVLARMDVKIEVEGLERVPKGGSRYTFVSNHPLGGVDGLALCGLLSREFGAVKMPVNDFLMYLKPISPLCIPVNKLGGQARSLPRLLDEAFRSEDPLLLFPAGSCSRRIDGRVQDFPWTKTFITKSRETGRSVVPLHFIGENSPRFYRADAFFRKFLRLKFNVTMLFLPDELYRARHKTFRIVFGAPLPPETFDDSRSPLQWAARVREDVYRL